MDPPVLGLLPFRDIEIGKDLDPRRDRGAQKRRERRDFAQEAVDAEPYLDFGFAGLDVDVAGAFGDRAGEDLIHDLYDRNFFAHRFEPLDLAGTTVVDVEPLEVLGVER